MAQQATKQGDGKGKGLTKEGKPRQRAYRTYYAINNHGVMIRFGTYEDRERAIRDGEVTKISAHEARDRHAMGEQAVSLAAARTVSPKTSPDLHSSREQPHASPAIVGTNIEQRDLVEALILIEQASNLLDTIKTKMERLSKAGK